MKLETLERFLNKDQDSWNREDLEKLTGKYGKTAIFYDTEELSNRIFLLFKCRDMMENDKIITGFITGKNDDYNYIINFIGEYINYIDFTLWPLEIGLHVIYKTLCERFINEEEKDSLIELKIKKLAKIISEKRYEWIKNTKDKREDSYENK